MDSYWDLYVAYIDKCVRENWENDIDPHHYRMEWNHFLPRAVFGEWPIGQWLTKKQHSIASALQTLAFNKCVVCPWHVKHLPAVLWEAVYPIYSKDKSRLASETHRKYKGKAWGLQSPEYVNSPGYLETRRATGRQAVEHGTGVHSKEYKESEKYKTDRDRGRETQREKGVGIYAVWESTVDGYRGSAGVVARHNIHRGWDPNARVRVS
jgi:hypothetical protein